MGAKAVAVWVGIITVAIIARCFSVGDIVDSIVLDCAVVADYGGQLPLPCPPRFWIWVCNGFGWPNRLDELIPSLLIYYAL